MNWIQYKEQLLDLQIEVQEIVLTEGYLLQSEPQETQYRVVHRLNHAKFMQDRIEKTIASLERRFPEISLEFSTDDTELAKACIVAITNGIQIVYPWRESVK